MTQPVAGKPGADVGKGLHNKAGSEWWKPARTATGPGSRSVFERHISDQTSSPAQDRSAVHARSMLNESKAETRDTDGCHVCYVCAFVSRLLIPGALPFQSKWHFQHGLRGRVVRRCSTNPPVAMSSSIPHHLSSENVSGVQDGLLGCHIPQIQAL